MSEWNATDVDQFWGLTEELAEAVTAWKELPDPDRAFNVVLCAGHCLLYKLPQPSMAIEDFTSERVFVELFYSAWREVRRMIELVIDESEDDAETMQPDGGIEARTLALDVLQSRLLFEGLQLFYEELQQLPGICTDSDIAESFRQRLAVYRQLLEHLDAAIDAHPEQMSLSVQSTWPHNVRMTLPSQAWQPRPWWLTEYANALLEDHQELVGHLIDDRLSGLIVAKVRTLDVSLVRPAVMGEEFQGEADLRLAADSSLSASLCELAEFRGGGDGLDLSSRLRISMDYRGQALYQLPTGVACSCAISVSAQSAPQDEQDDSHQLWRLRWGPMIIDVVLNRIALGLTTEWLGDCRLNVGQLQELARNGAWPQQYWRRLS